MRHHPVRVLVSCLLSAAIVAFPAVPVRGQGFCGTPDSPPGGSGGEFPLYIEDHDTLRALVIFADFSDGYEGTLCETTSWPPEAAFPAWADSLVEDTLTPAIDVSMTRYFDLLSSGQHKLMGRVHDTVIRVDNTIQWYVQNHAYHAWQYAAGNVIDQAMAQLGSEATAFDSDDDDYIDAVFIYFRQFKSTAGDYYINDDVNAGHVTGVANLFPATESQRSYVVGSRTLYVSRYRGILMTTWDRASTGGGYDRSLISALRVANHEYGHLLNFGTPVHTGHIGSMGPYSLMNDTGQGAILEAYVRHKLDWFNPPLVPIIADTTVVLGATLGGTGGNAVIVATADPRQFFALEVRDSTANRYLLDSGVAGCRPHRQQSGLLITHVREGGSQIWDSGDPGLYPPFEDPEIATGMFDEDRRPDPVLGEDAFHDHGLNWFFSQPTDLFRDDAATATVFAPYTNPSTNLYPPHNDEPGVPPQADQSVYSGIHFYNIHWKNPATRDSMVVSIRFDGTTPPSDADTVAVDTTWEGLVQVMGDVVVAEDATLTIKEGTKVIAAAEQDVFSAGRDEGRAEISAAGAIDLQGSTEAPILFASSRDPEFVHWCAGSAYTTCPGEVFAAAPGDWFGIPTDDVEFSRGRIVFPAASQAVEIRQARGAFALEGTGFPPFALLNEKVVFEGNVSDVSFDRDQTVPTMSVVSIPAGWRIGFTAGREGGVVNDGLVEILVEEDAQFLAVGTPTAPIFFVSDDPTPSGVGWYGIRFDLFGFRHPAGYMGAMRAPSRIENATMSSAANAVRIENYIAPSLVNVTFADNDKDVYLFKTDVFLSYGYWPEIVPIPTPEDPFVIDPTVWDLQGTRIVAHTSSDHDAGGAGQGAKGTEGLVDLFVDGEFRTSGAPVVFESTDNDAVNADDWGAVWLEPTAIASIVNADFGYGLTLLHADSLLVLGNVVQDSYFHHFQDAAIRLVSSVPMEIAGCTIQRGAGLDVDFGARGIDIKECSPYIHDNLIEAMNEFGIFSTNPPEFCSTTPAQPEFLRIVDNTIDGTGAAASAVGVRVEGACDNRNAEVTSNLIKNWAGAQGAGVVLHQCVGLELNCNNLAGNRDGLDFSRTSLADGPYVAARQNHIGASTRFASRTDNGQKLKVGPGGASSDRGWNILDLLDGDHDFIIQNDTDVTTGHILDARDNFWRIAGGADVAAADTLQIRNKIDTETSDPDAYKRVDIRGPRVAADPPPGYAVCHPEESGSGAVPIVGAPGRGATLDATHPEAGAVDPGAPGGINRTEIGRAVPSPTRAEVDLAVRIQQGTVEHVRVDVYDVLGRRVRELTRMTLGPGEHRIHWDGRDEEGRVVSAGAYFFRATVGELVGTRKVLVLR